MISDKKAVNRLALLFTLMYMVSYITRINYGAVISEMVKDTGYSKSMLSMALTGSFITYGVGQ
ncbi:MAG: MFS transporter, partial [Ruminococcaceae bacterium]|nr:MFS transporter [Oscillospiraceae bacterium]